MNEEFLSLRHMDELLLQFLLLSLFLFPDSASTAYAVFGSLCSAQL